MFWMIKEMFWGCPIPWNRSAAACWWSVIDLLKGKEYSYLWSFTVPDVIGPREFALRHRRLLWLLDRAMRKGAFRSDWGGVRVFEFHPGGHGLHAHWGVDQRLDVNLLRPLAESAGFGIINVRRRRVSDRTAGYLAKYVNKKRGGDLGGLHRWACIGPVRGYGHRVNDVRVTTSIDERFAGHYWEFRESFPEYAGHDDQAQWYARVMIYSEDTGLPPEKFLPENREFIWGKSFPKLTRGENPF